MGTDSSMSKRFIKFIGYRAPAQYIKHNQNMTNSQKEAGVTAASFSDKGEMRNDGIFTGNKLESIVDFFKDRSSGYDNCLFSGNFLCT